MLMPKGYARFQTHIYKLSYLLCDMLFIYREANVNLVLLAITYVLHVKWICRNWIMNCFVQVNRQGADKWKSMTEEVRVQFGRNVA